MEKGLNTPYSIQDYYHALPAAGKRNGTDVNNVGSNGNYWSSSPNNENTAWNFYFFSNGAYVFNYYCYRSSGQSVRVVIPER